VDITGTRELETIMAITSDKACAVRFAAVPSCLARAACSLLIAATSLIIAAYAEKTKTDAEIKQAIITDSLASYPGTCACPYNIDRAGHRCGRRSAYSRPGVYSPVCYDSDVTKQMIREYRKAHNTQGR